MAILKNRSKIDSSFELTSFFLLKTKRVLTISLVLFSLISMSKSVAINTHISSLSLEIIGKSADFYNRVYQFFSHYFNNSAKIIRNMQIKAKENAQLKLKITELETMLTIQKHLEIENTTLKQMLSLIHPDNHTYVTARLIAINNNVFNKSAIIRAGANQDVALDQIVVGNKNLLGKIIQVGNNYSKVMLTSDLNSRIPVVTSISRTKAILAGDGNKTHLLYLPKDNHVEIGEQIITSGDGDIYPADILVGEIVNFTDEKVIVDSQNDLSTLDYVTIYSKPI